MFAVIHTRKKMTQMSREEKPRSRMDECKISGGGVGVGSGQSEY